MSPHEAVHPLHPAAGVQTPAADSTKLVMDSLADMKAEESVVIDLADKSSIADAMIIATGRSNRHVGAIADKVMEDLKAHGRRDVRVEGTPHCDWVLIDAGDVVVHIFRPDVRAFYNLEKLWGADRPGERIAG
jgi:ribosome-associated protein